VLPTIIGVAGEDTVTLATAAGTTVSAAVPVFPSLVAVMTVAPAPTAVTIPEDDTFATAVFPLLQITTRPVRTLLLASRVVAVACVVWPA
jgi:hypothetical protein